MGNQLLSEGVGTVIFRGYAEYCVIFASGEEYHTDFVFGTMDELMHYTSYTHMRNLQEVYGAIEVRLVHVQFEGVSYQTSDEMFHRLDSIREPFADYHNHVIYVGEEQ